MSTTGQVRCFWMPRDCANAIASRSALSSISARRRPSSRDFAMTYALSGEGLACLQAVSGDDALLAFDIDGTLAPIAAQPWAARIPDDIQRLLTSLNRVRPVAIVTGRR